MPYYTGSANSFEDLRTALFNACVAQGWTLSGEILTKGSAAVKVVNNTVSTTNKDIGLVVQGGTSVSAGALVNPSLNTPRMGRMSTALALPTWPMIYHIHINNAPDEVYMVANYGISYFYWLAFGVSAVPGLLSTGLWVAANAMPRTGPVGGGVSFSTNSAGNPPSAISGPILFFATPQYLGGNVHLNSQTIATGLDSAIWGGNPATQSGTSLNTITSGPQVETLLNVLPNAWNSESPLVPIKLYQWRDSAKFSLVADLAYARYVRIDNYVDGQVITLGSEQWKIYPFYRKNTASRSSGTNVDHTGTYGWAIKYDGA